jgi:hypothetical protein
MLPQERLTFEPDLTCPHDLVVHNKVGGRSRGKHRGRVYVHIFGYTHRPVRNPFCCRTLCACRAALIDQLFAHGDLIDERGREKLAENPELQKEHAVSFKSYLYNPV